MLTQEQGNHDITLDEPFFNQHGSKWRYPSAQVTDECKRLLTQSTEITYLEHEAANIRLSWPQGPQTSFTVFGSPYSPQHSHSTWGFQYAGESATKVWECIPSNTDIVVTHTPPKGVCDKATKDEREGCEALLSALSKVRPLMAVCGHIHEARGVQRVIWNDYGSLTQMAETGRVSLVQSVEEWDDPGAGQGNKKQSLVNLSAKGKVGQWTLRGNGLTAGQIDGLGAVNGEAEVNGGGGGVSVPVPRDYDYDYDYDVELQPDLLKSTSAAGLGADGEAVEVVEERRASVVVNAAFLGPRIFGKTQTTNKAIVVDVDLPVNNEQ